jgi:CRISPR system Cascade subunit CasE
MSTRRPGIRRREGVVFLSRVELGPRAAEQEAFWREVSQPYGAHQALWRLLSRGPEQKRDFLFRAEESLGHPSFLVLSAQRPEPPGDGLWRIDSKAFAPVLKPGQRLGFRLRASPVVRRGERVDGKRNKRVHRHDVVMDAAKRAAAVGGTPRDRAMLLHGAGMAWLQGQAKRGGFHLVDSSADVIGADGIMERDQVSQPAVRVDGYRQHRILRRGATPIRFSTLEFEGLLEVTDPAALLTRVIAGFGPQKALGCGLMLLRRA